MRTFECFRRILSQVFYFFTFDLESSYHHVSIVQHHQQFLGFSWLLSNGARRYFTFKVLPFGLSTACFVFTKLLRLLVTHWWSIGHVSLVYIDDGISGACDRVSARASSLIERGELVTSGLKCNEGKSNWEPRQVGELLGHVINTIQMIFQVPLLKIEKPKAAAIHAVLNCQSVPVRDKLLFNDLLMVYKYLKNLTPGYLHGRF